MKKNVHNAKPDLLQLLNKAGAYFIDNLKELLPKSCLIPSVLELTSHSIGTVFVHFYELSCFIFYTNIHSHKKHTCFSIWLYIDNKFVVSSWYFFPLLASTLYQTQSSTVRKTKMQTVSDNTRDISAFCLGDCLCSVGDAKLSHWLTCCIIFEMLLSKLNLRRRK
jgi:hypothetical protein